MRAMLRRFTLLICLLGALAVPAVAHAQSSPFQPLPPAVTQPDSTATTATTATVDEDEGLAGWQQVLIFLAGAILLIGIAWAIVTDARSHTPKEETEELEAAKVRKEADLKRRKARNRAATKRSRESRKRNR
jgi:hypothetical protein